MRFACGLPKVGTRSAEVGIRSAQGWHEVCMRLVSQGLLGLCCSIETRDHIERITLTAVLFE